MESLEALRQKLPDVAKDIKLNLQSVLSDSSLSVEQRWGVALAAAVTVGNRELRQAVQTDAAKLVPAGVLDDAAAAAVLMAMNNVFYRTRHMLPKEAYQSKPPRLRMNRLMQPASGKLNLELFSLAVSALNGCEACVRAHEKTTLEQGASEDNIIDALRIASVIRAAATALEITS